MTEKLYHCVLVNDQWHCTQEQANAPVYHRGSNDGGWTICGLWGDFVRGLEDKRPLCKICLKAIEYDEETYPGKSSTPKTKLRTSVEVAPGVHQVSTSNSIFALADKEEE